MRNFKSYRAIVLNVSYCLTLNPKTANSIRRIKCLKSCDNFLNTCNMCGRPKCSSCNVAFPHKNALSLPCKSRTFLSNKDNNCNAKEDRNAFNNFFIDSSENDLSYFDFFHKNEYFDIGSLNGAVGDQNFSLMHFNVRSIHKTLDELANLLTQLKALPDVILAITETKPKPDQVHTNINLEGYTFIQSDSEKLSEGVGFYIKNFFNY